MDAGASRDARRVNRRRQSPARALAAALGRLLGPGTDPQRGWARTATPSLAASRHRLVVA
jgi:hypothetical protein